MTKALKYDRFGDPIPQSLVRLQQQKGDPEADPRVVDGAGFRDPALRARVQRIVGVELGLEAWHHVRRDLLEGFS